MKPPQAQESLTIMAMSSVEYLEYVKERARLMDLVLGEVTEELSVGCSRGCAYCCYGVTLWIRRSEALLILDFLNRLPLRKRKVFRDRLRAYERVYREEAERVGYSPEPPLREGELDLGKLELIGGLGMNEVPCPFLEESGECGIYAVRPDMCRIMAYRDAEACRRDWENPLSLVWKSEIAPFVEEIREKFYSRWRLRLPELGRRFPGVDPDRWEGDIGFVTYWLRFDLVKKRFSDRVVCSL